MHYYYVTYFYFLRNAHKVRPYDQNNDLVCGYNHLEYEISVTLYIGGVAVNVQGLKRTTAFFLPFLLQNRITFFIFAMCFNQQY